MEKTVHAPPVKGAGLGKLCQIINLNLDRALVLLRNLSFPGPSESRQRYGTGPK
jgi:hypothetical protein